MKENWKQKDKRARINKLVNAGKPYSAKEFKHATQLPIPFGISTQDFKNN